MTRKVFLGIPVLAGLSLGQMCGAPAPEPFDRLGVNDSLRAACASLPDAQIQSLIMDAEADRLNGVPMNALITAMNQACLTRGGECSVCTTAIIKQVYQPQ